MNVGVLGCGPTGLIAADMAMAEGNDVTIYSRRTPSVIAGAMFLQAPMGWYSPPDPEFYITIKKWGTKEGYAVNVYGEADHDNSWDSYPEGRMPGWNMKKAYDKLWKHYNDIIVSCDLDEDWMHAIIARHDIVFSSVPLPVLCLNPAHRFDKQHIVIVHGPSPSYSKGEDMITYNGLKDPAWYRYSRIGGYRGWEYSIDNAGVLMTPGNIIARPGLKMAEVSKPLETDCDCWPEVHRIGRYGQWKKGVLVHHVKKDVNNAVFGV
jgi:hypothetical protein